MSNTPVLPATIPPPRNPTPLPTKTYATYNDALENLRYRHSVLANLCDDYWRDYEREQATVRERTAALLQLGYSVARRRLAPAAHVTPQMAALMVQMLVARVMARRAWRGWREADRVRGPLRGQLSWEEGEEAAERMRVAFVEEEGGRIVAERRRRKGKGKEVEVVGEVEVEEVEGVEEERIVAERRRRKGKGKEVVMEVVEEVEEEQRPAKRGRVGEASSSRG